MSFVQFDPALFDYMKQSPLPWLVRTDGEPWRLRAFKIKWACLLVELIQVRGI